MNKKAILKEYAKAEKQEERFLYRAASSHSFVQEKIIAKIPQFIYKKLDKAFGKAFKFIYNKGSKAINLTYSRERMKQEYEEDKRFAKAAGTQLGVNTFHHKSIRRSLLDGLIAAASGMGLGFIGRGIGSIPIFVSIIFRNMYETCLCYGFDCDSRKEQFLMLKMMETAITTGEDVEELNDQTDQLIAYIDENYGEITSDDIDRQIEAVSQKLSEQILYLKALQIIPIVGAIFGFSDVIYFTKVHRYIDFKYRKRFLKEHM